MKNRYNYMHIFFAFIYTLFSVITIYLIISKRYLEFLTPKSIKYLIFMSSIFIIFSIIEIINIKKPMRNIRLNSSLVLLIPMGMLFLPNLGVDFSHMNNGFLGNSLASQNNQTTTGFINGNKQYKGETLTFTIADETPLTLRDANSSNSFYRKVDLQGLDEKNKTIEVSDDQFYDWITTIFADQNKYIGYKIIINGKVYRDPAFMKENEFVPARQLMTCCVADTVAAGLIADYDGAKDLTIGKWVRVTGTLKLGEYNGQKGPVINIESISDGKPVNPEYIYPK